MEGRLRFWTAVCVIVGVLSGSLVGGANIPPTSMFVTQNMVNTNSNFCWEYSGNPMYLPVASASSTGWDSTLVIQFDLSKYAKTIRSSSRSSYLSLRTYCDSNHCTCTAKSLVLKFVKICDDLCSSNSYMAKDSTTIVSILERTNYASDNMQTSPATTTIRTDNIFQYRGLSDIAEACSFKYFTVGIVNSGGCNAWIHVDSWNIEGI
ncbi:signal peptide-containing protein [Cryptosporidium canis]|uniref:Signal peptide-containing protein n=1 Tax=Cryptosporidium canis TaxID=195482 RepID=A0ABQ8P5P8_9CRYT|nr:signal peptide-containing protein [Cryptosporidium canis]